MTIKIIKSTEELEVANQLLDKHLPKYRQAYSDRTAWLMACLSELAYIRFNPLFNPENQKEYFLEAVEKLGNKIDKRKLEKLIDIVGYDPQKEKAALVNQLETIRMSLIDTFDTNGTQAILVDFGDHIVLSFRGTEATSIKDIKADAKAISVGCKSGGRIHKGFRDAFDEVALDIQTELNKDEHCNKPLFITGHSLGGALATIAAKKLTHRAGISACYTFGSPRVGDEDWVSSMKTPLYRVVNAADCVTMLPPGSETITVVSWLTKFIPFVGHGIHRWLLAKVGGYYHGGDMKYLTNCPPGDYSGVKLLFYVSFFHRVKAVVYKKLPFKVFLADHSIAIYRQKLEIIARQRNGL